MMTTKNGPAVAGAVQEEESNHDAIEIARGVVVHGQGRCTAGTILVVGEDVTPAAARFLIGLKHAAACNAADAKNKAAQKEPKNPGKAAK